MTTPSAAGGNKGLGCGSAVDMGNGDGGLCSSSSAGSAEMMEPCLGDRGCSSAGGSTWRILASL